MRRLLPALSCALIAMAAPAQARTAEDEQFWLNLTAMGPISGDLVYFAEIQPRFGDGVSGVDQTILRGGLGWKLSPSVTVYQGYAHVVLPVDNGRDVNEERSFQQVNWTIGKPWGGELSSRTRLEQRWRSDGDDMGWRLREMLRYEKPLGSKAVSALVYGEGFVALNSTDWGAKGGFDQLRSFIGAEIALGGASTAEIGYLNQWIDRRGGNARVNHVASVTLFFRH
ncbi:MULTISPECIES: DUF2490 domain-containing protein [Sphingobium]|uniref:DUF2490 domain-containing protein n=1 Tax=Sphingobium fuliginis (strain ATCC 27551) TaxID=336203 RepID=A0ABQ1EUP3_SPHSA|nr:MULTISPECIES: DUF2490 domain-containing protein [Sphingobium]AJR25584.1 hypothetical protein TZ53_19440 [Sphingobium sp. YBL2]RYL98881.1 DUF2490 domain-containing protein [Sphingobium fuliginis]UXC92117.1 DUF2490 domain-containing protein [Sphingobium sp. RSMS]WDA37690.1 DUF2490 domain-containing protein [Sphingobium sp. YC-XJ3]GFZ88145.1 hypothetical protein GCM10019071_17210 [Sphingobium fuliginis]